MLATLGDLVEDVVVRLAGPVRLASDTEARIERRRGGSAANVASTAARLGAPVRFLGQVGDDSIGGALLAELAADGVDTASVRRAGTTGTIVVLVDHLGERSMVTDRRTCVDLRDPDEAWLDGVTTLHVPCYSLAEPPLAETAATLIGWARDRGVAVSIDLSSTAVIDHLGVGAVRDLIAQLAPDVLLANRDEAAALAIEGPVGGAVTVVKRGADPAIVHRAGWGRVEVAALPFGDVGDTTGAGDAFAAGFLTAVATATDTATAPAWRTDPVAACLAGHRAAATLFARRGDDHDRPAE